jgi:glycine/D-amino acid oxidase-like deaminating enzyme
MPDRRIASRLPTNPGPCAWSELLPPPPPAQPLEHRIMADWLVIGGGFAGLAAARRLSQLRPRDRIVLLEATRLGQGPAGRNSGFMIDLPHQLSSSNYAGAPEEDTRQIRINRAAIAFAAEAAEEYGLGQEAFSLSGKVNAAATEGGVTHNADYAQHLTALGESHEILDAQDMRALTGSAYYLGGLRTPGTAMIQPAMFVRGIGAGLAPKADIYEHSAVVSLTRRVNDWRAETLKGAVTAPRVILAVNGHAESFGYFRRRLMHIHLYASMTRALTPDEVRRLGGEPRWGLTPSDPVGTTVRRISGTGGDRIVVRNRVTYDPDMAIDERRVATMGRTHDASFAARFPMLEGVGMEYRWGGRLCLSWNSAPAFGEVDEGVFAACCQNGLGAAKGTASGILAAELAVGSGNPLVDDMLALGSPRLLPPEPLTWIGANAAMRWKEWKAGAEM